MMMWGPYGWEGMTIWGGLAMLLYSLVWIALAAAIVVGIVRWAQHPARAIKQEEAPLEILQRRYAAGEISREEYQRMRDELREKD